MYTRRVRGRAQTPRTCTREHNPRAASFHRCTHRFCVLYRLTVSTTITSLTAVINTSESIRPTRRGTPIIGRTHYRTATMRSAREFAIAWLGTPQSRRSSLTSLLSASRSSLTAAGHACNNGDWLGLQSSSAPEMPCSWAYNGVFPGGKMEE